MCVLEGVSDGVSWRRPGRRDCMKNEDMTKRQLKKELTKIRQRVAELETLETEQIDALRKSEEKYRNLVENLSEVVYTLDDKRILTYVSPAIESLIEYSQSEVIGHNPRDFVHQGDLPRVKESFERVFSGHESVNEYRLLSRSGKVCWVRTSSRPIVKENRILGIQGILTDITERKMAEDALRESEEKFRTFAEQSPNMIFINLKGKVVYANKKCEEIMGYKREEFYSPNFNFLTLIAPESRDKIKKQFERHMKGMEVPPIEYSLVTKEGARIDVILSTKLIQYGEEIAILGTITDIRDRKQMEKEREELLDRLRERVRELRCIYGVGELLKRRDMTIEKLLEKTVQLIPEGLQYPEITGSRIVFEDKLYMTKNFQKTEWMLSADIVVGNEKSGSIEVCYLKRRPESDGVPFSKEERNLLNTIAERLATFIERKHAEEKLRQYSEELEKIVEDRTRELQKAQEELIRKEKLATAGRLAGIVGHEIRNPLCSIGNSAYYLNMKLKNADLKVRKHLAIIEKSVQRADKIITDLLELSNTREPFLVESSVNDIILDVLSCMEVPQEISVRTEFDESIARTLLDPDQMQQVFASILSNAMEAMPKGGRLDIATEAEDGIIRILVKDTGRGISEDELQKIFEPLYTTKIKGVGLGLAMAKSIVEGHKGTIEVKSKVGEGTVFIIELPL